MQSYNQLPAGYSPSDYDVVIGKGKKYYNHKGNAMLRVLTHSMLPRYNDCKTKLEKSLIISEVSEVVREKGNFIKRDNVSDDWVLAEDLLTREKVSAVLRDSLHQSKKSPGPGFMLKKSMSSRAIKEQQARAVVSGLGHTTLSQARVPLPSFALPPLPAPLSDAFTIDWPSILREQQTSNQHSDSVPAMSTFTGKKDLFSIFSLALSDIGTEGDDPFEPRPICEQRFEGNRCA